MTLYLPSMMCGQLAVKKKTTSSASHKLNIRAQVLDWTGYGCFFSDVQY